MPSEASACTLYASASGDDAKSGTSPNAPKTFNGAAAVARAGSVICVLPGQYQLRTTFYPPASGSPTAWIVYKSYGDGDVNILWAGGANGQPMVKLGAGQLSSNPAYLEFRGLKLDGQENALDGFLCMGSHHLRFIGNTIRNTGGAGIASLGCDYLTSDHNTVFHNGYRYGWTSGISYNSVPWFDAYAGLHNIISNNLIAGEYDGSAHHTDGNGIILDLSNGTDDFASANTPPALVLNNVVFGNGGRCIEANTVTRFWIVNNTCYMNDLDPQIGAAGSISTSNARDGYIVNNISSGWNGNHPCYDQEKSNANLTYTANLCFGAGPNFPYSDPAQILIADPRFAVPPQIDPTAERAYAIVLAPGLLGDGLRIQPASPALQKGVDPSGLPNLAPAIVADLRRYIYADIKGNRRPQNSGMDLGAYQF